MKSWLKNLLFVLFSFVFLGIGMFVAQLFSNEKGNPLNDPNFLVHTAADSTPTSNSLLVNSIQDWMNDTVQVK